MITHADIGRDEDLAREVLVTARSIAPCLLTLDRGSEEGKDAIAIVRRVYADLNARGSRFVSGQRVGPAQVSYFDIQGAFAGQPAAALRALCRGTSTGGAPKGSFPAAWPLTRLWLERP